MWTKWYILIGCLILFFCISERNMASPYIGRGEDFFLPQAKEITVTGVVKDKQGQPLPGVNVAIKGTGRGVSSDAEGKFRIQLIAKDAPVLVFTFIGMETKEVTVKASQTITVVMEEKAETMEEVVVTGIYERKKESFTGSTATYTAEALKAVGTQNLLQSLKTLDPSFAIVENNQFGSDPNRLPDIEIRGKSSILGIRDEVTEDPNQPLFILDGFETTLETIYDLDMNRVASITILKDAASTAIYGSKAANGVVVVETIKPKAGKLLVSYNGSLNISAPDLSSYNLMNAEEKLQFELLAGKYTLSNQTWGAQEEIDLMNYYYQKLADIRQGVNTYWLAEPIRTGLNHKHSVYAQGGEGSFLFGIGLSYNNNAGVMKESKREGWGGNIDLTYRVKKFQFTNKLNASGTQTDDPIVAFSTYAAANPYYKKYNSQGRMEKWLEYNDFTHAANPLWNAAQNSRQTGKSFSISDYFIAEFTPVEMLKLRLRFGLTRNTDESEQFYSTKDTRYENEDILNKGEYTTSKGQTDRYEGEFTLTFAQLWDKHRINIVAGGQLSHNRSLTDGYSVRGFPEGDFTYPSFSKGFSEGSSPAYRENVSRSVSAYANGGYSYDDRYLMDLSYRINGSSVFGASRRFTGTWSVGLAWNIHREKFISDHIDGINMLKIRASVGNPGNQNFSSSMRLTTFSYGYSTFNYFGMSTTLSNMGNPDLKWQTTLDKNIGMDITIFHNRLTITMDYYHKNTDPLLISIGVPSSTGVASSTIYTNLGRQISQGFTGSIQYYIFRRLRERIHWSVKANLRTEKAELNHIGNSLEDLNKYGQSRSTKRYYDKANPNSIWAVRSAGIDPSTGRELFIDKEGNYTYDFSYDNEVVVGNERPKAEGVVGTSFVYKGFSCNADFRYKMGGSTFNNALYNKVENISDLSSNQDKRALYNRWQKPGDAAQFKDIANSANTPMSSRFVQKENSLSLESFRIGYEFTTGWIRTIGFSSLRINAYMNDIFRLSSIKSERGTDYPFARSMSFSLSFNL